MAPATLLDAKATNCLFSKVGSHMVCFLDGYIFLSVHVSIKVSHSFI